MFLQDGQKPLPRFLNRAIRSLMASDDSPQASGARLRLRSGFASQDAEVHHVKLVAARAKFCRHGPYRTLLARLPFQIHKEIEYLSRDRVGADDFIPGQSIRWLEAGASQLRYKNVAGAPESFVRAKIELMRGAVGLKPKQRLTGKPGKMGLVE